MLESLNVTWISTYFDDGLVLDMMKSIGVGFNYGCLNQSIESIVLFICFVISVASFAELICKVNRPVFDMPFIIKFAVICSLPANRAYSCIYFSASTSA